ncbi:hypothetical protein P5V15_001507 [Pogonomyrmex californicus]
MRTKEERGRKGKERRTKMTTMTRSDTSWRMNGVVFSTKGVSRIERRRNHPGFLVHVPPLACPDVRRGQRRWLALEASRVPIFGSVAYRTADVISGVATPSSLSRSSAARQFTTHPHG